MSADQTTEPDNNELKRFVAIFERLSGFEATQRLIRGYGAFDTTKETLPDPAVVKTLAWLKERIHAA